MELEPEPGSRSSTILLRHSSQPYFLPKPVTAGPWVGVKLPPGSVQARFRGTFSTTCKLVGNLCGGLAPSRLLSAHWTSMSGGHPPVKRIHATSWTIARVRSRPIIRLGRALYLGSFGLFQSPDPLNLRAPGGKHWPSVAWSAWCPAKLTESWGMEQTQRKGVRVGELICLVVCVFASYRYVTHGIKPPPSCCQGVGFSVCSRSFVWILRGFFHHEAADWGTQLPLQTSSCFVCIIIPLPPYSARQWFILFSTMSSSSSDLAIICDFHVSVMRVQLVRLSSWIYSSRFQSIIHAQTCTKSSYPPENKQFYHIFFYSFYCSLFRFCYF